MLPYIVSMTNVNDLQVLVIGDTHDSPDIPDKSQGLVGLLNISEKQLNQTHVVQIGDFVTLR